MISDRKFALITGSTKGIGRAIGEKLLLEGYYVIFNYAHSDADAQFLNDELGIKFPNKFSVLKSDLSKIEEIDQFYERVLEIASYIDIIVFNAGITDRNNFDQISFDNWMSVMNANINVPVFLLKKFKDNIKNNGNIIFIGSLMGDEPHSVSLAYGISKGAVHILTKNLVKIFALNKIRVNCIAPGFIQTDWQDSKPEWLKEKICNKIALNRFGESEEVASLVYHVISNNYINGEIIHITGGYNYM